MVGAHYNLRDCIKKVTALERLRIIGLSPLWRVHLAQFLAFESLFSTVDFLLINMKFFMT